MATSTATEGRTAHPYCGLSGASLRVPLNARARARARDRCRTARKLAEAT